MKCWHCPWCGERLLDGRLYCNSRCHERYKGWQLKSAATGWEPAERTCLACGRVFLSTWRGHRICSRCRDGRPERQIAYGNSEPPTLGDLFRSGRPIRGRLHDYRARRRRPLKNRTGRERRVGKKGGHA